MAAMRKRIVFVIGSLAVGGAEMQMTMLAEGLKLRGWTVAVFALDPSGPLAGRLDRAEIPVFGVAGAPGRQTMPVRLARITLRWLHLLVLCLRKRPDVVHAYLPLGNFLGASAARLAGVPVTITARRGLGNHQDRHPGLKWMDRIANALSSRVTANSRAVARDVTRRDGYPENEIAVIPNGLSWRAFDAALQFRGQMRRELGLQDGDIAMVKVANLLPYKGHTELIEAFARVASDFPGIKLLLVGQDRGIRRNIEARLEQLGIAGRVRLLGERNDVARVLAAMDIGVMASHEEGLSNALIEKLAMGLPVVATDVGGNAEVLDGMPNCRLVRARDADDLARGLAEVIAHLPDEFETVEMRRRLVRTRYSEEAMIDRYERLYSDAAR